LTQATKSSRLDLEATRPSATTGLLELASLGLDVGFLVLVGTHAKVPDGLTGVLGATEEECVAASGGTEGQLVESDGLTTSRDDAGAGGVGEPKGGNGHLGDLEQTVVIGDSANDNDGLAFLALGDLALDAGDGDRGSVDAGHEQPAEDDLVEGRVGSAGQEAVQLYQELEVDIVALGRLAVGAAYVVAVEIDTYPEWKKPWSAF
jgi:hypothetical protein